MSGNHWWDDYGSFRPWKICPTRPDPGEVVQFYLNKRGIETEKQITYLIDLLDLQKSMVYNISTKSNTLTTNPPQESTQPKRRLSSRHLTAHSTA